MGTIEAKDLKVALRALGYLFGISLFGVKRSACKFLHYFFSFLFQLRASKGQAEEDHFRNRQGLNEWNPAFRGVFMFSIV